jgi:hypothetical protein
VARKDPFPNEWQDVSDTDPEEFETATYEEILDDITQWDLPEPFYCVIRAYSRKTNKLKEYAYKHEGTARKRLLELAEKGEELTILVQEYIGTVNYKP